MVVEPQAAAGVVWQVCQDVIRADGDPLIGDVLGMDEHDVVDRFLESNDDGARQAIQIPARDQTHRLFLRLKCVTAQAEPEVRSAKFE